MSSHLRGKRHGRDHARLRAQVVEHVESPDVEVVEAVGRPQPGGQVRSNVGVGGLPALEEVEATEGVAVSDPGLADQAATRLRTPRTVRRAARRGSRSGR
jgi:hypothetical protein